MPEKNPRRRTRQKGHRRRVPSGGQPDPRFSELSPQRAWLVRELQQLNFGTIMDLRVRNGEPCPEPPPRIRPHYKLDTDEEDRPEADLDDFALSSQVIRMFLRMEQLRDGIVKTIKVKRGQPFTMEVEKPTVAGISG